MTRPTWTVATLLFFSGMCSLVYETVWIRELRLVFGASTSASAAVVACFIGGLGVGGLWLGRRADRMDRPLGLYANLEGIVAVSAAVTPLLLMGVRAIYIAAGGTRALGSAGGAAVRLVLCALVFAVPTVAMGGTLPAVARAVEDERDHARRSVAVLYGANTLGAVVGCLGTTFVLLEVFGTRLTLWLTCLINLLVAVFARNAARSMPPQRVLPETQLAFAGVDGPARNRRVFVLFASATTGFVFCLMELVWYRMLGPLLGGSVFTFGLILAVALAGVSLGGFVYAAFVRERATLLAFATTCLIEALCVALPYAYGDRLAVLAAILRPMGALGFTSQALGWAAVTAIVVLPAAVVSGVQFPLLVALLGRGGTDVGRHVGLAYAWNTAGAIAGSLAGGFGLVPALSAPGCWRLVGWLLLVLGAVALVMGSLEGRRGVGAILPAIVAVVAGFALRAEGPSSAWRHSPIGAGRVDPTLLRSPNAILAWLHDRRRAIAWQADGRESSVAIESSLGVSFVVNGKNDGNARGDASTAIMLGLVGAILHPHPQRAMVIGLGTGSSAGWLAAIPSVTDVDVAELEPAIVEVARRSAPVNHGALQNPKVHLNFADAREALLTSRESYDLIASEPSNPYRAGVASLFTREYYEAASSRLRDDGIFVQWVQAYEVDGQTMRTVFATLASVFPFVETWEANPSDVLLVASKRALDHSRTRLQRRMAEEPLKTALDVAWRVTDTEGLLGHYVAGPAVARRLAEEETEPNTDDLNAIEFGFARTLGTGAEGFDVLEVRALARALEAERPTDTGDVDWEAVDEYAMSLPGEDGAAARPIGVLSPGRAHRLAALRAATSGNLRGAVKEWRAQEDEPRGSVETALLGTALADAGDDAARPYIERMRTVQPVEADLALGRLLLRQGKREEAWTAFEAAYLRYRTDPWPLPFLVTGSLQVIDALVADDPTLARRAWQTLREPFVMRLSEDARIHVAVSLSTRLPPGEPCTSAYRAFEPNPSWSEDFLASRAACYGATGHPLAARAAEDLRMFRLLRPPVFSRSPP